MRELVVSRYSMREQKIIHLDSVPGGCLIEGRGYLVEASVDEARIKTRILIARVNGARVVLVKNRPYEQPHPAGAYIWSETLKKMKGGEK